MTNNDVLRRIRYTFDFNDETMMALFGSGGIPVTRAQVSAWMKPDEDPAFQKCSDHLLATFLNGFIIHKRGKREGPPITAEKRLTNNIIFRKIKIALNLQEADTLELLALAEMPLSKSELSALFRKAGHKHYRACKDQILRRFLRGMQLKYRGGQKPV